TFGAPHGDVGDPVKDSLMIGKGGQQHHSGQEQINIRALGRGALRQLSWDESSGDEQNGGGRYPDRFRSAQGAQQHAENAGQRNNPYPECVRGEKVHEIRRSDAASIVNGAACIVTGHSGWFPVVFRGGVLNAAKTQSRSVVGFLGATACARAFDYLSRLPEGFFA